MAPSASLPSTQQQQWGTTPPISMAQPTDDESRLNKALIEELKRQNLFEAESDSQKRIQVLGDLQRLTQEFVVKVSLQKNMTETMAKDAGGKIFTYGSYRLGVFGPGSDIDTLMVVPKHVTRADFFAHFPEVLRAIPTVSDVSVIEDAYVPIIKFAFLGIHIDLIFARLGLPQIPRNLELQDNNLLKNIDEKDMISLNGTRVTDLILKLVPSPAVFKHALRAIKLWAQRHAIYGNVVGFPGGVAWAMLVARICQLYPCAVSATIVSKFFRILEPYPWPQPIMLTPIVDGPIGAKVWNPKLYPRDRQHLMPIITPAYPSMCATHNISESTKAVMLGEMRKAGDMMDQIVSNKTTWKELFTKHNFFYRYKYYLCIVAGAKTADQMLSWAGAVESKVRLFMNNLEKLETVTLAHPYNKSFPKVHNCANAEDAESIMRGEATVSEAKSQQLEDLEKAAIKETDSPESKVYTTTFYVGLAISSSAKQLDIQWPAQEFYETCKTWTRHDAGNMSIAMKSVRPWQLAAECFDENEVRPVKPAKGKRKLNEVSRLTACLTYQNDGSDDVKRQKSAQVAA